MSNLDAFTVYKIRIKYIERIPEHTRYCSDAGSYIGEESLKIHRFKVLKNLLNALINYKIKLINEDGVINHRLIPKDDVFNEINKFEGEIPCYMGSGHCGYKGYNEIKNVTIYKPIQFYLGNEKLEHIN